MNKPASTPTSTPASSAPAGSRQATPTLTNPSPAAAAVPRGTALVLGLTGGYGRAMAAELLRAGWSVRALVRDRARGEAAAAGLPGPVTLVEGAVGPAPAELAALRRAASGVDVVVHGVNTPYDTWAKLAVPMAQAVAQVTAEEGATLLFPGNVYGYAPGEGISERTRPAPVTAKGALRVQVEAALADATTRGARLIVLRGGDFFGLGHDSSWMHFVLSKVSTRGRLTVPGRPGVRHAWCFLPDFARAHVALLERRHGLPADARFHFAGHVLTPEELTAALRDALGSPQAPVSAVPWWALRLLGWVRPLLAEIAQMRYLWDEEVLLDQSSLVATLGDVPHTPLHRALRCELRALDIAPTPALLDLRAAA